MVLSKSANYIVKLVVVVYLCVLYELNSACYQVFASALAFIRTRVMEVVNKAGPRGGAAVPAAAAAVAAAAPAVVRDSDILWVLTVPAIWYVLFT